jgi:hypothetical protein
MTWYDNTRRGHERVLDHRYLDQGSPEWQNTRSEYLSASEIGAVIAPAYTHDTALTLWKRKTGQPVKPPSDFQQRLFDEGHAQEETICQLALCALFNGNGQPRATAFPAGRYLYENDHRFAASPDRMIWLHDQQAWTCLEVKSRQFGNPARLPTMAHYFQMQMQLACTKLPWMIFACANLSTDPVDMVLCRVKFDANVWATLYELGVVFWDKFIAPKNPPPRGYRSAADGPLEFLRCYVRHVKQYDFATGNFIPIPFDRAQKTVKPL